MQVERVNPSEPRYDVYFTRSADCGDTWAKPVIINNPADRTNQGATIAIDPRNGNVIVAWRKFDLTGADDSIMSVKYTPVSGKFDPPGVARRFPKGKKKGLDPNKFFQKGGVSEAIAAGQLAPFDQATSDITEMLAFRVKLSAQGHDSYGAEPGEHDDLVLFRRDRMRRNCSAGTRRVEN